MFSHRLSVPLVPISVSTYDRLLQTDPISSVQGYHKLLKKFPNILIIDDISDSGGTLKLVVSELVKEFASTPDTLTYAIKPSTKFTPTYHKVVVPDKVWVDFPWEVRTSC
jgi:hypoxanthine phosphoribosyltransferase